MIRKQIYLARKQQVLLARLAKARGVSEAEVIRQAIEHEATRSQAQPIATGGNALDEIIRFALERRKTGTAGEPLRWSRDDAYSERFDRFGT